MASQQPIPIEHIQSLLSEEVLNTVQHYFEIKVLGNGTLYTFLLDRIHELFHYLAKKKSCCNKIPPCASISRRGTLTKMQFDLLYKTDSSILPVHEKKEKGRISLHCICPLSPKQSTQVSDLDFTIIHCLIKSCRQTIAGHPKWLEDIFNVRNQLSHLGDTSSISQQNLEEWWQRLENATIDIAGTIGKAYQIGVKRRISKRRTACTQFQKEDLMAALKLFKNDFFEQWKIEGLHTQRNQDDSGEALNSTERIASELEEGPSQPLKFGTVGRSGAGKSSLILDTLTSDTLTLKYKVLRGRINKVASLAGIIAASPVPFLDAPINIALVVREVKRYRDVLGLNSDFAKHHAPAETSMKEKVMEGIRMASTAAFSGAISTAGILLSNVDAIIPVVGSAISAVSVNEIVSYYLNKTLDQTYEEAITLYKKVTTLNQQ